WHGATGTTLPLDLQIDNLPKLRVDTNSNVGVGTTAPIQKLDVNGNLRINQHIFSPGPFTGFLTDSGAALPIKAASLALSNSFGESAPANGLYVLGSVGIGVQSPGQKLDVNGNLRINQHIYSAGSYTGFLTDSGSALPFNGGSLALTGSYGSVAPPFGLFVEGSVGIGTQAPSVKLHVMSPTSGDYVQKIANTDTSTVGGFGLYVDTTDSSGNLNNANARF